MSVRRTIKLTITIFFINKTRAFKIPSRRTVLKTGVIGVFFGKSKSVNAIQLKKLALSDLYERIHTNEIVETLLLKETIAGSEIYDIIDRINV